MIGFFLFYFTRGLGYKESNLFNSSYKLKGVKQPREVGQKAFPAIREIVRHLDRRVEFGCDDIDKIRTHLVEREEHTINTTIKIKNDLMVP